VIDLHPVLLELVVDDLPDVHEPHVHREPRGRDAAEGVAVGRREVTPRRDELLLLVDHPLVVDGEVVRERPEEWHHHRLREVVDARAKPERSPPGHVGVPKAARLGEALLVEHDLRHLFGQVDKFVAVQHVIPPGSWPVRGVVAHQLGQ